MVFSFQLSSLCRGMVLVVCTVVLTISVIKHNEWLTVVSACGLVWALYRQWAVQRDWENKLDLMFRAIHNGDYSFRFPVHRQRNKINGYLNNIMNRYGELLKKEHFLLREQELLLEIVLDHVGAGVVVMDATHRVLHCNAEALRLLGLSRFNSLHQLERYGHEVVECFRMIDMGERCQLHLKSGKIDHDLWISTSSVKLQDKCLSVFSLSDIRAEMDEKELDSWVKLSHVLTHEIMNAIAPVASLCASLLTKEDKGCTDYVREGLKTIYTTSQGLLAFVENYRKFASLPKPDPELWYVKELTDEVCMLDMVPEHIQLSIQLEPEDVLVYADRKLIRQVLINLLQNAVQAIGQEEGGRIFIMAFIGERDHVIIRISNNGPVIQDDVRAHLFVPFFTTKANGSGIGLAVSRQIMALSEGALFLLPAGVNGWNTTFVMEFR